MSEWTHRCCETCWVAGPGRLENGALRTPTQVTEPGISPCCYCGLTVLVSGIYTREDPRSRKLLCWGSHDPGSWPKWARTSRGRVRVEPAPRQRPGPIRTLPLRGPVRRPTKPEDQS